MISTSGISKLLRVFTFCIVLALVPFTAQARFSRCEHLLAGSTAEALYDVWQSAGRGKVSPVIRDTLEFMQASLKRFKKGKQRSAVLALIEKIKKFQARKKINYRNFIELSFEFSALIDKAGRAPHYKPDGNINPEIEDSLKDAREMLGYYPYIMEIPTERNLNIREFNDLSPYPIYAVGFVVKPMYADGKLYTVFEFFQHDRNHGSRYYRPPARDDILVDYIVRGKIDAFKREIRRRVKFYQAFRKFADSQKNALTRETLEVFWFYLTHEVPHEYTATSILEYIVKDERSAVFGRQRGLQDPPTLIKYILKGIQDPKYLGQDVQDPSVYSLKTLDKAMSLFKRFLRDYK